MNSAEDDGGANAAELRENYFRIAAFGGICSTFPLLLFDAASPVGFEIIFFFFFFFVI